MQDIEQLKEKEKALLAEYESLSIPADAAYKKYQQVHTERRDMELYEKAKRQVMRDLLNTITKNGE